ncbi:uncharacterized protein LOC130523599 isoform X1 [Takifugu flavidus]|uniref:uncharacterized protein LOC130523599 isoform X1 n=1 Tax=Takifugu flavidus TaxID=433684 RepID=UPI0025446ADD|nr:uncharacterized protein LOC130523599 isoform X1 [Takifugu flavidus]
MGQTQMLTERIHREYYRLTENTLQLAKMSKLLMAIELGTDSYKGKSLDEIDLSLEIASSEPSGDAGEGPSSAGIFNDDSSHEASDMDEGFITKLLNTIILPNSDVPKKKVKKTKHLSANPLHSLHQRKGGKRITEDSDEEDNSYVLELSKLPATDQRRPWSDKEKAAVWRQLGKSIILKKVPRKQLCQCNSGRTSSLSKNMERRKIPCLQQD